MKICERGRQEMRSEFWDEEIWVWMDYVFSSCICGRHLDLLGISSLRAEMDGWMGERARVRTTRGARRKWFCESGASDAFGNIA